MALKLTANLVNTVRSITNAPKVYSTFGGMNISNVVLNKKYSDWSKNVHPLYREVGDRYDQPLFASRAVEDTKRYVNFLKTKEGVIFTVKQVGLQLSQPKSRLIDIQGTRIFNPYQFAANIPGIVGGIHLQRHGVIGITKKYEEVTKNQDLYGNRLVDIFHELRIDKKNEVSTEQTKIEKVLTKVKQVVGKVKSFLGMDTGKIIHELSGWGGPKSVLGIGRTDIHSYKSGIDPTDPRFNNLQSFQPSTNKFNVNNNYVDLYSDPDFSDLALYTEYYVDKGWTPGAATEKLKKSSDISNVVKGPFNEKYNELKNTEKKSFNTFESNVPRVREDYGLIAGGKYRESNLHKKFGFPDTTGQIDKIYNADWDNNNVPDIIELKFTDVYTGEVLQFRSTIKGFSTTFNPEWSSVDYVGRPDPVKVYKGVTRNCSFSIVIAASSKYEMHTLYQKINKLSNLTTPRFSGGKMIGPLVKLKLGNLIDNEPGYISALSYTVEDDFIWDIDDDYKVPMYIDANISFEIIGKRSPAYGVIYFGEKIPKLIQMPSEKIQSFGPSLIQTDSIDTTKLK